MRKDLRSLHKSHSSSATDEVIRLPDEGMPMYIVNYSYGDGKSYRIYGVCASILEFVVSEIEKFAQVSIEFMEYPL